MPALFTELDVCREWGMPYAEYLQQPREHRALMLAHSGFKAKMASVEYQEQRERRALKG